MRGKIKMDWRVAELLHRVKAVKISESCKNEFAYSRIQDKEIGEF